MTQYTQNRKTMHPALKIVILLAVYTLGYISGSFNQKQTETLVNGSVDKKQAEIETINDNSYDMISETNLFDDKQEASNYRITYDISYSELNKNEKEFYDKIISTAMNEDNTFITDKELSFILNTTITKNESVRVQSVLYNNYPDVAFYTTRHPNAWMYYVTHLINGLPMYRTYYFNVKYK